MASQKKLISFAFAFTGIVLLFWLISSWFSPLLEYKAVVAAVIGMLIIVTGLAFRVEASSVGFGILAAFGVLAFVIVYVFIMASQLH